MSERLLLKTTITYGDVDRHEVMLLSRLFKMLQDAAIDHANQFGSGTIAVAERAESWVLNRIEAAIERYPRAGELLDVETWSIGIKGFKGYREFRVRDAAGTVIVTASSLWLYISLKTKSLIRVPRELAAQFPVGRESAAFPQLEHLQLAAPSAGGATFPVTLRYSDFDVNHHVNNASYFELVQTALVQAGFSAHPRRVALKYAKEIQTGTTTAAVRVERVSGHARFSIEGNDVVYAVGEAEGEDQGPGNK
jgi:acyl-ACP thioesterase